MNKVTRLDNGTIEIILTLPWSDIKQVYDKEVDEAVKNTQIPGFRKGQAPRSQVEAKLDKSHLYSHSVQHLLPDLYTAAVKSHHLKPILSPQIKITQGQEGHDWEFSAVICEAPVVNFTLPAKLPTELPEKLDFLRKQAAIKIPDLLVEEETNHRLTALAENITKLGLTTDQYLSTKRLTPTDLKGQTSQEARIDLETEYILLHIQVKQKLPDRKSALDYLQKLV